MGSFQLSPDITINGSSLTGANNLVLNPGTSTVSFGGGISINIGDIPGNTSLTINDNNAAIGFNALTLAGGLTVTTSAPGPQHVVFQAATSIGGAIDVGALDTAAAPFDVSLLGGGSIDGVTTIANTGVITLYGGTPDLTLTEPLDTSTASATHISGTITQTNTADGITMDVVVLDGDAVLTTNDGAIDLTGTVDGAHALTINTGTANATFNAAVGATTPLTSFSVTGNTINQLSTVNTTGAISYTGPSAINVGDNLTTAGGIVTWNNPATLAADVVVDTTNGGGTATGANIAFANVNATTASASAEHLTLNAGSGGVITLGTVGGSTPLGLLTISNATSVTANGSITIRGDATGGGTLSIAQPVTLGGTATFTTTGGGVTAGNNISLGSVNGAQAFVINAGTAGTALFGAIGGTTPLTSLSMTGAIVSQTLTVRTTGAITYTGPTAINVGGNLTTSGGIVTWNNPATLTTTLTVDTTNSGGTAAGANIILGNVNAATATIAAEKLTLLAGSGGAITLGTIGGSTPLGLLTITGGTGVTAGGSITIRGNATGGGTLSISQPVTLGGAATFTTTGGGVTAGNNITLGTVNGAQVFAINAGSGGTAQFGAIGGTTPLTSLGVIGATVTQTSTVRTTGAITYTGPTAINVGGNLTTAGGIVTWSNPATLTTTLTVDTTNGGGTAGGANIILGNVNATTASASAEKLTLNAGTGGIVALGTIGGSTPLGLLTISNATGVTANGSITIRGDATSGGTLSITQPVTLGGAATFATTGGGVTAGNNITLGTVNGAQVFAINAGTSGTAQFGAIGGSTPLTSLTVTGATVNQTSTVITTGAITYTGSTAINLGGNLTTAGGIVTWNNPATLTTTLTVDTTNGGGTAGGANIVLGNVNATTASASAEKLTLLAGSGGAVTLGTIGGSTPLGLLTITGGTGVTANGNITIRGDATGGGTIGISQPITLSGAATFTTTGGGVTAGNNITLGTVNGAQVFAINAGTAGTAQFGAIGGTTPLTSLSATGATVTQSSTVRTTGSISYTGTTAIGIGGNLTTTSGVVTWNNPATLNATAQVDTTNTGGSSGAAINIAAVNAAVAGTQALTLNAGASTVAVSGALGASAALNALTITGNGGVSLNNIGAGGEGVTGATSVTSTTGITFAGTVYRANAQTYTGPVILSASPTFTSSNDAIAFTSTINGAQALTVNAGTNTIGFGGAIGGSTPLTSLSATGTTITQSSTVSTVGAVSYTPATALSLGGSITTQGGIVTVSGATTLAATSTINTTNASPGGAISLGTVNAAVAGTQALTLTAGTSTVSSGVIGASAALSTLTITANGGVALNNIGAGSAGVTGATSVTSTTGITINGTVYRANAQTYTGPVILNANPTFTSSDDAISFTSTINGAHAVIVNAGASTIGFGGAIGGSTPLTSLSATGTTITQSSTVSTVGAVSYTPATVLSLGGSITTQGGIVTVSGATTLVATSTINTTNLSAGGANINLGLVNATAAGAQNLTLLGGTGGSITLADVGSTIAVGDFTITSGLDATVNDIITQSGSIAITPTIVLASDSLFDATNGGAAAGGGNIAIGDVNATTPAGQGLTLNAGSGGTISYGSIGATTPLSYFIIVNAGATSLSSITTAGSPITIGGTSILVDSPVVLDTTGGGTVPAGADVTLVTVEATTAGVQGLTITAGTTGDVSIGDIGTTTAIGPFTITEAASATLSDIITQGGSIDISAPLILGSTALFDTTNAGADAGASISLTTVDATTAGVEGLTMNAGTSTVNVTGAIGNTTALNALTVTGNGGVSLVNIGGAAAGVTGATSVTSSTGITLAGTVYNANAQTYTGPVILGASPTISSSNDPLIFTSTINGVQSLIVNAGTSTIAIQGAIGNTSALIALTLTGNGGVSLANIGAAGVGVSGATSVTSSTGITLNGTVYNANTQTYTGPVNLAASPAITSSNDPISFTSTINGTQALTVNAGTSTVSVGGAVGNTTPLSSLTVTGNGGVSLVNIGGASAGVSGATSVTSSTGITFSGTIYNANAQTYTGPIVLTASPTVSSSNDPIIFTSTIDGVQTLIVNAGTSTVAVGGAIGNGAALSALTITGNGGVSLPNIGGVAAGVSGATSITSSTGITFTGGIYNANAQTYAGPVALSAGTTVSSSDDAISFTSTIDGGQTLVINAGASTASVTGAIGNLAALTTLTVTGNGGVSLGNIGGGAAGVNGATLVTSSTGITLTGTVYNANAQTYTGPVSLSAGPTITSSNDPISFTSTINGTQALTVNAGTSTVSVAGAVGNATPLSSFTVTGNGGVSLVNIGGVSAGVLGATSVTSTTGITFSGTIYNANAQTYTGPVVLSASPTVSSSNDPIIFTSTIDGLQTLIISAGTSTVSVGGAIGNGAALSALTITGNGGVSLPNLGGASAGVGGATSVTSTTGITFTGTVYNANAQTYTGPVTLNGSPTITSSDDAISFSSNINGAGSLTVNAGTSTLGVGGSIGNTVTLSALTLTGNGGVTLGGIGGASAGVSGATLVTSSTSITFSGTVYNANAQTYTGPVLLTASPTISSSNDPISFTSTINGARSLTVNSGTSTVAVGGVIGGTAALTALTITGNGGVTLVNIGGGSAGVSGAAIVNSTTGIALNGSNYRTGSQAYNGPVDVVTNVNFIGSTSIAFSSTFDGAVDVSATTSTGDVTFGGVIGLGTALTTLTVNAGDVASIAAIGDSVTQGVTGAIDFTAATKIALMGTVYNTGQQTFHSRVTLGVDPSLVSNNMPILFSGAIDGPEALSLDAGTSTVTIVGPIGATTPLPTLDIFASGGVTIGNIGGASPGVSGATTINTSVPINLTGTTYNGGEQTYGNDVQLSASTSFISNGGDLIFAGTIDGTAVDLSLNLGGGELTLTGAIGGASSIDAVTILNFTTAQIAAITASSLTVTATSGTAFLNDPISITNDATISVGSIFLGDTLTAQTISITSQSSIVNAAGPVALTAPTSIYLNALGGDVGSLASPIEVDSATTVTIGSSGNAYLTGSPSRLCVDYDFSNEPLAVFFDGAPIFNCNSPPPPPSPPSPSNPTGRIIPRLFYVPGIYSTDDNFSSYPYNIPYLETWDVLNLSARIPPLYFGMLYPKKEDEDRNDSILYRVWGI